MAEQHRGAVRLATIIVLGRPSSVQATHRAPWMNRVRAAGAAKIPRPFIERDLRTQVTVFYKEPPRFTLDVDNASKPICDALKGVAYDDDDQLIDRVARIRKLDGQFLLDGVALEIVAALRGGEEFVAIELVSLGEDARFL